MLTSIPSAAGTPIQVFLVGSAASANAVVYTVPAGKTFRGHLLSNGTAPQVNINGAATALSATAILPITLLAGTVVRNSSSSPTYVLSGIEE